MKTPEKLILILSLLFPLIGMAQIDGRIYSPPRYIGGLEFLTVDIAPQNAALGNAGVANPSGGFLQNPALLANQEEKLLISTQYSHWLTALGIREFHYGAARIGFRINDKSSIGLTYQQFSSFLTEWFFDPILPFHQFAPRLYYAQNQKRLNWGLSLGYIRAGLEGFNNFAKKSDGISLSGGITTNPYQFWGAKWIFAASLSDLGPRQARSSTRTIRNRQYSYLPTTFRIGGQSTIKKPNTIFNLHFQFEHLLVPRNLDSINSGWLAPIQSIHDAPRAQNWQEWQCKLGFEWAEIALGERLALALRLGWQYEAPEQGNRHLLSTGLGIKSKSFSLDAAFWQPLVLNHSIQNTLMFSFAYRWSPD